MGIGASDTWTAGLGTGAAVSISSSISESRSSMSSILSNCTVAMPRNRGGEGVNWMTRLSISGEAGGVG